MLTKGNMSKIGTFYDKVRGREVQWQRKIWFMAKESEGVAGATGFSQDLAG